MKNIALSKLDKITLENIIKDAKSYKETLLFLGYSSSSGEMYKILKSRIDELNIDISHFYKKNIHFYKIEDILIKNSPYLNRTKLKEKLLKNKLLTYKCSRCENTGEWDGEPLSLQLEHINGISNDNRLENLTFLCPNCHSLTKTYGGKNVRLKKDLETIEQNKKDFLKNKEKSILQKEYLSKKIEINLEDLYKDYLNFGISFCIKKYSISKKTILKKLKSSNFKLNKKKQFNSINEKLILSHIEIFGYKQCEKIYFTNIKGIKAFFKRENIPIPNFSSKEKLNEFLEYLNKEGIEETSKKYEISKDFILSFIENKKTFLLNPFEVFQYIKINSYSEAEKKYNMSASGLKKFLLRNGLNPIKSIFKENLNELKIFLQKNNHLPTKIENEKLYRWILALRKNNLSKEESLEVNALNKEILNPETKIISWEEKFNSLEKFIKQEKRLPKRTNKDKQENSLAEWIRTTIRIKNKERILAIESLKEKYNLF